MQRMEVEKSEPDYSARPIIGSEVGGESGGI